MATFNISELDLTVDNSPGTIVDADGDGVRIITRDGLTLRLDGQLVDRVMTKQAAQELVDAVDLAVEDQAMATTDLAKAV